MNKRIQVFAGPQASGKTQKVDELAEGKKAVCITNPDYKSSYLLADVQEDTELVVFDGVAPRAVPSLVKELLACQVSRQDADYMRVNRKYVETFILPWPQIIIVTQEPLVPFDVSLYVDVTEFPMQPTLVADDRSFVGVRPAGPWEQES